LLKRGAVILSFLSMTSNGMLCLILGSLLKNRQIALIAPNGRPIFF
jgi:hypothetical protein